MKKFWIMASTVALLGFGAAVVSAQVGGSSSSRDAGTTEAAVTTHTTTTEDRTATGRRSARRDAREPGEDVSGPCDEAEHAGDPRCTGATGTTTNGAGSAAPTQVPAPVTGDDDRGGDRHGGRDDATDDGPHGADDRGDDHGGEGEAEVDDHGGDSGPGGGHSGPGGGDED